VFDGDADIAEGISEETAANPLSPYALQKYLSEKYCLMYNKMFSLDISILRYFNVYGP
jgi:nucleoside-diphosphate-sugar epimerase